MEKTLELAIIIVIKVNVTQANVFSQAIASILDVNIFTGKGHGVIVKNDSYTS